MRRLGAILGLALTLSVALPERAAADSIDRTWAVGEEPFGVVIDPTDGRVYVANSRVAPWPGGSISVVDPSQASGGVTQLATSGAPGLLALDPIHRRLYSSNQDGTLQVFDLTTMSLEATLSIGGWGVVVDPSTRRVYVSNGSRVSVLDGATNSVLPLAMTAPPGDFWIGLALDPAWNRLYVTNGRDASPSVVILDNRDLSFVREIELSVVPRFALAVDATQHHLYLAGYSPNSGSAGAMFMALDGSTFAVLASTAVPGGPMGMTLAPGTHRIYLTSARVDSSFSGYRVFDDRSFSLVQTAGTPWSPGLPALHPDGRLYVGAWHNASLDELVAILPFNSAPEITALSLTPSQPSTNDVLRVNVTAVDRDFTENSMLTQPVALTYEWSRNGVVIPGQTGSSLDLSLVGDRGDTITVRVTASDGELSTTATKSVVVANTAPIASVAIDPAAPTTNQIVTATATSSDADGDALTYTFTWKVNSVVRSAASGPNAWSSFDLSVAGNGDRGQTVSVEVRASDGTLENSVASASAVVVNSSPTAAVSLSDTSPRSRDVLVATASTQDADADPLSLTYTWRVNGVTKQVGTSNHFDLAPKGNGDKGDIVTVTVTASDGTATATAGASATVTR